MEIILCEEQKSCEVRRWQDGLTRSSRGARRRPARGRRSRRRWGRPEASSECPSPRTRPPGTADRDPALRQCWERVTIAAMIERERKVAAHKSMGWMRAVFRRTQKARRLRGSPTVTRQRSRRPRGRMLNGSSQPSLGTPE